MNIHRVGYLTCSSHELMTILFKSLGVDKKNLICFLQEKLFIKGSKQARTFIAHKYCSKQYRGTFFNFTSAPTVQYSYVLILEGTFYSPFNPLETNQRGPLIHVHKYFSNMVSVSWKYSLTNRLMKLLFMFLKETSGNPLYTMT